MMQVQFLSRRTMRHSRAMKARRQDGALARVPSSPTKAKPCVSMLAWLGLGVTVGVGVRVKVRVRVRVGLRVRVGVRVRVRVGVRVKG